MRVNQVGIQDIPHEGEQSCSDKLRVKQQERLEEMRRRVEERRRPPLLVHGSFIVGEFGRQER